MELEKYKVELAPDLGIILVEHPLLSVSLDKLIEIKGRIENSTKKKKNNGIIKRCQGYYFSYRLSDRQIITCVIMDKLQCVNETKEVATSDK